MTKTYPGKGLSISQLIFALNEELKHAVHSPSLTFDEICRIDRGVSAASLTIREWRNSFVHINQIPSKVLSLIATHLESQKDRFRATFVCRHWRRTFLQHPALWSWLDLRKGEVYVKTVLERAKGSALDVFVCFTCPVSTVTLLLPPTKQIGSLCFASYSWTRIRKFVELNPGPLPLLRTLRIITRKEDDVDNPDAMIPPSLLFFSSAVDLQEFRLESECPPLLNRFVFPSLTLFELSVTKVEGFRASLLLDFLEASPMLRTVHLKILTDILFDDIPRERAIVLPNVESLSLVSDGEPGYNLVTHISCPMVKDTSLTHKKDVDDIILCRIFPDPASWDTIVRQYKKNLVEQVTLEIKTRRGYKILMCSLIFESPNAVLRLCLEFTKDWDKNEADFKTPLDEIHCGVFSEACRIIRDLPLLASVKHLKICPSTNVSKYTRVTPIANEVGRLFKSLGPLEELTLSRCDMRPYFAPSVVFPSIKELTISHPLCPPREGFEAAIVGLAKSQHALGVGFESVTVDMDDLPEEMAKRLGLWVRVVCCRERSYRGN